MPISLSSLYAPTAATVATAVAGAVPTTAGITSIVQANAGSPYGGTWTYLGYVNPNGTNTATFTGLSSYKYLKLTWIGAASSTSADMWLKINGDNANNFGWWYLISASNTNAYASGDAVYSYMDICAISTTSALTNNGTIEIRHSNSSGPKSINLDTTFYNGAAYHRKGEGLWNNTNAISSLAITLSNSTFSMSTGNIRGFYLWGGN